MVHNARFGDESFDQITEIMPLAIMAVTAMTASQRDSWLDGDGGESVGVAHRCSINFRH
jgi:hypothetical protein